MFRLCFSNLFLSCYPSLSPLVLISIALLIFPPLNFRRTKRREGKGIERGEETPRVWAGWGNVVWFVLSLMVLFRVFFKQKNLIFFPFST